MVYLRLFAVSILVVSPYIVFAANQEDAYIAGYATAVLKQNLNLELSPMVKDGVITLPTTGIANTDRDQAVRLLMQIPGVSAVNTSAHARAAGTNLAATPAIYPDDSGNSGVEAVMLPTGLLPAGHLFKPLLADPRWAHFSASYRNYQHDSFDGEHIASVSFGETIPFYRSRFGHSQVQWETGLQAGVFSDFNLDTTSMDLVNTDFIAAFYASMRINQFSAFARLFHQSSHLGDEFLLRKANTKFERVNLSYEGLDLRLSYELPFGVRLYGGGGGLFDREPSSLKPWLTQYGIEFRSPWRMELASLRPIIAADFKNFEENKWSTDISVRAGFEFENLNVLGRKLQILGEYFNGYTPSGQFYKDKVEYFGVGAHYHF